LFYPRGAIYIALEGNDFWLKYAIKKAGAFLTLPSLLGFGDDMFQHCQEFHQRILAFPEMSDYID
jgi:hypothetical protein